MPIVIVKIEKPRAPPEDKEAPSSGENVISASGKGSKNTNNAANAVAKEGTGITKKQKEDLIAGISLVVSDVLKTKQPTLVVIEGISSEDLAIVTKVQKKKDGKVTFSQYNPEPVSKPKRKSLGENFLDSLFRFLSDGF